MFWPEKTEPAVESTVPTVGGSELTSSQQETEKQQCERQEGK